MQHHGAVRRARGQQPLLHGVERNAVHLCSVRLAPLLGLRAAQVPDNELLVVATGPKDGGVAAVPRHILHHTRVAIESCGGLQSLRSSKRLSCGAQDAYITTLCRFRNVASAQLRGKALQTLAFGMLQLCNMTVQDVRGNCVKHGSEGEGAHPRPGDLPSTAVDVPHAYFRVIRARQQSAFFIVMGVPCQPVSLDIMPQKLQVRVALAIP